MAPAAIRPVLLVAAALAALPASAEPLPGPVPATLVRVVDGDTIRIEALVWIDLRVEVLVRIGGIDAPELNGQCPEERAQAVAATEALAAIAADGPFRLHRIDDDKYFGRVVADVETASGVSLAAWMLATGLVRPYDGGARQPWCPQLIGAL
ncbi:MAG: thermonuclease family protein [Bauldia sp.]